MKKKEMLQIQKMQKKDVPKYQDEIDKKVYEAMVLFWKKFGYPPSLRALGKLVDRSRTAVNKITKRLEVKGKIERKGFKRLLFLKESK